MNTQNLPGIDIIIPTPRDVYHFTMAPAGTLPPALPGPHPSYIQVAKPFIFEQRIQGSIISLGGNPVREDSVRLQGVAWIDDVRRALQL